MNLFSFDSWLSRFLYFVADVMILHILWIIFSLPIVTIGASTTAVYYSGMKRIRRDEGHVSTNFMKAFKSNFKQSTIIWLLILLTGAILITDLRIGMAVGGVLGKFIIITCSVLLIPFFCTALYIFPVQAKFENRIIDNLKNAFLMSFSNFVYTLLLIFITVTFILLTLTSAPFIGLMIICGLGIYAYITSCIYITIFRKYLPNELKEDIEATKIDQEH